MKQLIKGKFKAFSIHLAISLVILLAAMAYFVLALYPSFYFDLSGGFRGLKIIILVDMVIGPLLTLIIFNPKKRKKEKISDFTIIGLIQFFALLYGFVTVYNQHPKLLILYETNSAVILPYKLFSEETKKRIATDENPLKIEGVDTVLLSFDKELKYNAPLKYLKKLEKVDQFARDSMTSEEQKNVIKRYEKKHEKVWVFLIEGQYNKAYVLFDENFNYLKKLAKVI